MNELLGHITDGLKQEQSMRRESEKIDNEIKALDESVDAMVERLGITLISSEEKTAIEEYEERQAALEEERKAKIPVQRLIRAGFGDREIHVALGTQMSAEWTATRDKVLSILSRDQGGFACISGVYGTGKTVMAASVANAFLSSRKSVAYLRAIDFFLALKAAFRKDEDVETQQALLKRLSAADLLIMDELQDRSAGDWENSVLNNLVDKRYSACKPTLILTNETDRNKLREGNIIPASTRSRLKQTGGFISLNWGSYR